MISFRSFRNRLFGNHTLIKYTVDGIDSLNSFNDSLGLNFYFLSTSNQGEYIWRINGQRKDGKDGTAYYKISFVDHKKVIQICEVGHAMGAGPFGENVLSASWNWEWKILKLEKNDIRMKTNYNGKEYFIELN